ncbi:MAG: hypothetical protein ACOC2M_02555 [bacterium]
MITDSPTNTVYFSNLTPEDFRAEFNELNGILTTHYSSMKIYLSW